MAVPERIGVPVFHIIRRVGSPRAYRCAGFFSYLGRITAGDILRPGHTLTWDGIARVDKNLLFQPRELEARTMKRRSAGTSCSGLAAAKGRRESNLGLLPRSTKAMKLWPEPPVPAWRQLRRAASRPSASCLGR